MTEQLSEAYYEVCRTDVKINADSKKLAKISCSTGSTAQQYVRAMQRGDLDTNEIQERR